MLITFKLAKLQLFKEKALQRAHCLLTKAKSAYLLVVEMKLAQMTLVAKLVNPPSLILQPQWPETLVIALEDNYHLTFCTMRY